MKVLFLTLLDFNTYAEHNIYCDLLRVFIEQGHDVYAVSPIERRNKKNTHCEENGHILKVKIGNVQKTNILEKGLSTILLERQIIIGIKKYFTGIKFDLVLYSTPPITFASVVKYIKKRDNATTYLMLKDIFPQNAVDIGMLSKKGIKGVIYKYFRRKEKKLYALSDRIGCMSKANVDYITKNNCEIDEKKVEICPNCIEVRDMRIDSELRSQIRKKYGIPEGKKVFVYGGNLGKPQGIPFIIECLKSQENNESAYFLIVGNGTEYSKLENYFDQSAPKNAKLLQQLPKADYDLVVSACDVGMIFLDHRFTIPNFPSRLLSYMQSGLPVMACTDPNTDVGKIIVENRFGWWCESNNVEDFGIAVCDACMTKFDKQSEMVNFLRENYDAHVAYEAIINCRKNK